MVQIELFSKIEIGDKVKHKNTGDHIYTIKSISNGIVATIIRPKELWVEFSPRLVVKVSVCMIENLIKI